MYRLLEIGEVIETGDEWYDEGAWRVNNVVGQTYVVDIPLRRLVTPAVTAKAAESVKSDPVVNVGDRVTVLTGPWAGCTGVVTGFEVQVSMLQTSMRVWRDSVPVVELDHVRVGGQRLTVKAGSLEKLPPVVPEVLYRDLAIGETIRQGDEFWTFGYGPWADAGHAEIGKTVNKFNSRHRRPVRIQSPGWRYLDAGETVQAGDEVWCHSFRHWERCGVLCDSPVNNEKLFRRKLPANVGG